MLSMSEFEIILSAMEYPEFAVRNLA
jgi:hypothetical protein